MMSAGVEVSQGATSTVSSLQLECAECRESLTQQRYILFNSEPFCIRCFESKFANVCHECNAVIATDSKDVGFKDKHWHEKCFMCTECRTSLIDKPFANRDKGLFCAECYEKNPSKCAACGQPFHLGAKKYLYQSKQWHEECFKCSECGTPIGTSSFIPYNEKPVCIGCYQQKYAVKCSKCSRVIDKGGLKYKGVAMHAECFKCAYCQKLLANVQFAAKDDKQYCTECYGMLFSKKCARCEKPITGLGSEGTKFVTFETRNWHTACFNCSACGASLVGKGFVTQNNDIFCPECDRNK